MRRWLTILVFVAACGDDSPEPMVEVRQGQEWSYGECFRFEASFQVPEPARTALIESVAPNCLYVEYINGTNFSCIANDIEPLLASVPPEASFVDVLWLKDGCDIGWCCENKPIDLPFSGVSNASPGQ